MITAVILTHNDEKTIERTLESLTWCDELVVIDDNSVDKTPDIARKAKAQVFTHALAGDFAALRNFALTKARGDWVLFVDSDEVVPPQLAKEIRAAGGNLNGYYLKRRDFLFGRGLNYGETAAVRLLRLARKNAGKWVRPVHEVWEVSGPVGELQNSLEHYPHQTVFEFIREINRYTTMDAEYLKQAGVRSNFWQIITYPIFKFLQNYFWRRGFLDGTAGLLVAMLMSFYSFLKRAKLYMLWDKALT